VTQERLLGDVVTVATVATVALGSRLGPSCSLHLRHVRRWRRSLEDDPDDDLAIAIHLVEDARAHALALEESTDRGFELDDEEIHGSDL
jgi:hypothetical protein